MTDNAGFIGWVLGGTGIILAYSAYKNESPLSVVQGVLTGSPRKSIQSTPVAGENRTVSPGTVTQTTGENDELWRDNQLTRSKQLMTGTATPVLVPIPTQPSMKLDVSALPSFMAAQAMYGAPITLTGAWRSEQTQRDGYESDPSRFAPPGHSAHEKGIAVDVNADKVNVTDPRFVGIMNKFGWVAAGKSGPMHFSYGIRA